MELLVEILAHYLAQKDAQILFPDLKLTGKEIIELQSYQALQQIQHILQDETLDDEMCLIRIEKIIQSIEDIGGNCGSRHDFG